MVAIYEDNFNEQLEKTCRNQDATLLPVLACTQLVVSWLELPSSDEEGWRAERRGGLKSQVATAPFLCRGFWRLPHFEPTAQKRCRGYHIDKRAGRRGGLTGALPRLVIRDFESPQSGRHHVAHGEPAVGTSAPKNT